MGRRRHTTTYRARRAFKFGPAWLHYFRRYSAAASADGVKGGFTSHGIRVRIPVLGPLTVNLTRRTWTWDNPGPGNVSGSFGGDR